MGIISPFFLDTTINPELMTTSQVRFQVHVLTVMYLYVYFLYL